VVKNWFQVHAAVAATHARRIKVFIIVPFTVIASPVRAALQPKAAVFRAGFDVLIISL
jgi:hypothetical protein